MNPEEPSPPTPDLEQRLISLLLGELPEAEAAALRQEAQRDANAGILLCRLQSVVGLLREAHLPPDVDPTSIQTPLRLKDSRRQVLLQHFKTVKPTVFNRPVRRKPKHLVVAAMAALFVLLLLPALTTMSTRTKSQLVTGTGLPADNQIEGLKDHSVILSSAPPAPSNAAEQEVLRRRYAAEPSAAPAATLTPGAPSLIAPEPGLERSAQKAKIAGNFTTEVGVTKGEKVDSARVRGNEGASFDARSFGANPNRVAAYDVGQLIRKPAATGADSERAGNLPSGDGLADNTTKEGRGEVSLGVQWSAGKREGMGTPLQTLNDDPGAFVPQALVAANDRAASSSVAGSLPAERFAGGFGVANSSLPKDAETAEVFFGEFKSADRALKPATGPLNGGGGSKMAAGVMVLGDTPTVGRLFRSEVFTNRAAGDAVNHYAYNIVPGEPTPAFAPAPEKGSEEAKQKNAQILTESIANPEAGRLQARLPELRLALGQETDKKLAAELPSDGKGATRADPAPVLAKRALIPAEPEIVTRENPYSTFSLNVSDVSFRLAAASLESGTMPEAAGIRSEEFINAFDYRDPEPAAGLPIALAWERARYPFAQNREILRLSIKTAAQGRASGRPLNLVLLLDNSGSMERADRVRIIREGLNVLAGQLQPQDKLSVVTFARTARLCADGVSGEAARAALGRVAGLTPEGGTNLEEALRVGYEAARRHFQTGGINRLVLLTDGAANLGDVSPGTLKRLVESQRLQGVALDCFGIGWEGYNDDLLENLSRNGDGRYGFLNTPDAAATDFAGQLAGALHVAASDVKVQVQFNPSRVRVHRQIGYAKHQLTKEQFRDNTVDAAEIGAAEAGNALYIIETVPQGSGPLATVRVRYKVPGTSDYREQEWVVGHLGNAPALEGASAALRLASVAGAFSEWLATSPWAGEVTPDRLLQLVRDVPQLYSNDPRPQRLEWMIRQAKSISGK